MSVGFGAFELGFDAALLGLVFEFEFGAMFELGFERGLGFEFELGFERGWVAVAVGVTVMVEEEQTDVAAVVLDFIELMEDDALVFVEPDCAD